MEGGVYICGIREDKGKVKLWVKNNPKLFATGFDLEDAKDNLLSKIVLRLGDGEAVLEICRDDKGVSSIVALSYHEHVEIVNDLPSLFEGGICAYCGSAKGPRNKTALVVSKAPKFDLAVGKKKFPTIVRPAPHLFSERFADLLNASGARLDFQPVLSAQKTSRKYFELISPPRAAAYGIKGASYPNNIGMSWKCSKCKFERYNVVLATNVFGPIFLSKEDVGSSGKEIFTIKKVSGNVSICMTEARWSKMLDAKLKGVLSEEVEVLPRKKLERPKLPDFDPEK